MFGLHGPFSPDGPVLGALVVMATPVAHVITWVTRLRLQQEEAILVYLLAIPITLVLLGAAFGLGLDILARRRA